MSRYLSPEWFGEINAAASQSEEIGKATAGAHLTLQQVVTGGPEEEVRYWVRVADGSVEAGLGDAQAPDATIIQAWDTAVALVSGELDVQTALMSGRVRISGNMAPLMEHQGALEGVNAALAQVRESTDYA